jgi:hypothetical protein
VVGAAAGAEDEDDEEDGDEVEDVDEQAASKVPAVASKPRRNSPRRVSALR